MVANSLQDADSKHSPSRSKNLKKCDGKQKLGQFVFKVKVTSFEVCLLQVEE